MTTNWATATQATGEPTPHVAGTGESFVVSGLAASTTYWFGLETADEVPNWSAISNSPSGTTSAGGGTIFSDDFTGKTVGQVPSGWTCSNSSFQVQSDSGNLILKNMGTDSHVWPTDSVNTPANWNNFEMTVRIRDQDTLDFRNAGGATYLRFQFTTGGVTLYDMPNWTSRGSRAALTAATWYRMRMQANGTNVKARFWLDGSGEPGTWDINATVTAVTGGKMDWNYAANISVDDVVVSTIGGGGDTTAPATVSNLATSSPTSSSLLLSWTAPGDDGSTGTATTYDLRTAPAGPS